MNKEDQTKQSVENLSEEDLEDQIESVVEALDQALEELDLDPRVIDAAIFTLWASRWAERGDREGYNAILEAALEEPWDEITIH